ncbi:MAG TPA: DUF1254 domain-containing protein [Roseiarcus sp.]|nr:DUF1254 domain-containing protein [Roseiarcus sp.]
MRFKAFPRDCADLFANRSPQAGAMLTRRSAMRLISCGAVAAGWPRQSLAQTLTPQRALPVARDAFVFGYPMIESYGAMYASAIDSANPQYRAPFNQIHSQDKLVTPEDSAVAAPDCDNIYSWLWADLRAEPLVLSVPAVERGRYYSIQFVDLYTWNFAYVGSRATGNGALKFLLVGPGWKGDVPRGVRKLIQAETQFVLAIFRIQLFNANDLSNVEKIQAGFTVEPASAFARKPAPPAAPQLDFPKFSPDKVKSLAFFDYLSFLLQFCPMRPADDAARETFAAMGVEPGKPFNLETLWPEMREALNIGMTRGLKAIEVSAATTDAGVDRFGTRRSMKNNYLNRAAGAMLGIYGPSKSEIFETSYHADIDDRPLDGAANRYALRFERGQYPPVKAFWSLTLYDGATKLVIANPLNRYLINSSMLQGMARGADGGLTIYIQKNSPGKNLEGNWLPAPEGPFFLELRCYWPDATLVDGKWSPPQVRPA